MYHRADAPGAFGIIGDWPGDQLLSFLKPSTAPCCCKNGGIFERYQAACLLNLGIYLSIQPRAGSAEQAEILGAHIENLFKEVGLPMPFGLADFGGIMPTAGRV